MQLRTKKKPTTPDSSRWSNLPAWNILPLRGFLGITFVYAGLQKLTDPQFFDSTSHGYIGYQLQIFAHSSPLRWLLENLAIPHAALFGWLIALGELWVGIATLLGLFSRLTAAGGLFISGLLWLTATWSVTPYFLGSDSIYTMAWFTLLLTGMGDYSADQWLAMQRKKDNAVLLAVQRRTRQQPHAPRQQRTPVVDSLLPELRELEDVKRRALLRTLLAGGIVLASGAVGAFFARAAEPILAERRRSRLGEGAAPTSTPTSTPAPGSTPAPTAPPGAIGNTGQIQSNSDLPFTIASSGDPGVVVHLPSNQFVAYDAVCTHAGCTVGYDPSTSALICPCHGAAFDPANNGAVLGGPTNQPLASVPIRIDISGNIFVNG